jgi:hypothetical protein
MKYLSLFLLFITAASPIIFAQTTPNFTTCTYEDIKARMLLYDPNTEETLAANENFTQARVAEIQQNRLNGNQSSVNATYTIPVVLHVFHNGDDAYLDMDQLQSGLDIINTDFNGWNTDWNTIDPAFDSIKASLDIEFCLASIDPDGNPTTGVVYYDNEEAMLNQIELTQYSWDNYKYLNIYLPKYTNGSPSLFTAYANLPSTVLSDDGYAGITYSSIRWGYGAHSELEDGQEWASVGTHEVGHWLNLHHTFRYGCSSIGDEVDDTPPTLGGSIELEGCYNNDFSCELATNGSNYMDYNHDCKKMFTQGQVDRMTAALELPSRITLWSEENLIATGCAETVPTTFLAENNLVNVSPNPASGIIRFSFNAPPQQLFIYNIQGNVLANSLTKTSATTIDISSFPAGIYYYSAIFSDGSQSGKFIVQ